MGHCGIWRKGLQGRNEQLDRTVGKPADSEDVDIHFNHYVPDQDSVGRSVQLDDVEYEHDEGMLNSSSSGKSGGDMFSMLKIKC